jgi:acyl-CoA dehydrogenase
LIPRTIFSDEHELFRKSVRRFIEAEISPYHAEWEKEGVVPRELWLKAAEAGLLCPAIPTEFGGGGGDFLHSAVVIEELGRAGASGPFFSLHSDIVAQYVLRYGSDEQKRRWLPSMASGRVIGAIAMSEPRGGSDLQAIETTAIADGDDYIINGQKVFISNGQLCDFVIVAAQTEPGSRARGITLFIVEADRSGFSRGRNLEKIGLKAQDTSELFFSDVRVPASALLGEVGRGFFQLMTDLAQERLIQCVRAVAVCEAAIEWTVDYTRQREAFGRPISSFQNTQFKMAEMTALTKTMRVYVDRCLELHLTGDLDEVDAAMCKLMTTDAQLKVVDECLQLFGGWGYMWEYPIARAYADSRQVKLAGGSSEIMKLIIARSVFAE